MPQPLGAVTRGTTGHNRLRRSDRWLVHEPRVRHVLQTVADPLVVDLGYGALPVTTLELAHRLPRVMARVEALEVPVWRARSIAQATSGLSRDAAAYVDAEIAASHHNRIAEFNDFVEAINGSGLF